MANFDENTNERIERYLAGTLSAEERQEFEQELRTNADLRQALALEKESRALLGDAPRMELRELVAQVGKAYHQEHLSTKPRYRWWWQAAVVAVLVGVAVVIGWLSQNPSSNEALFAAYYEPYPAYITQRSADSAQTDPVKIGLALYEKGDYAAAKKQLEQVAGAPGQQAIFYRGICALELGESTAAVPLFEQVIADADNFYVEQATWYLALAYLQEGQVEAAKQQLKKILESPNHANRVQAEALLEQLSE
ncbi:MAG: tetratricopeptide repeat protein [Salibacteraceae bacterium]